MTAKPVIPRVTYRLYQGNQLSLGDGYLIRSPDGRYWCFPEQDTLDQNPMLVGALELDPAFLEAQPDTGEDTPLYLYRAVVNAPQEASQTLPPIRGRFQAH
jgi:hypothetical protein